jgi:NDP-sugar pyrophosphorylase family protein
VTEVLINLHAHAHAVEHFSRQYSSTLKFTLVHEKELLGSAGTVAKNRAWVESEAAFWILYADVLTNMSLQRMAEFHRQRDASATLGLCRVPDPSRCGVVTTNQDGLVVGFEEKPAMPSTNWVFSGVMLANHRVLDYIPTCVPADLGRHVLPRMLGKMAAYPIDDYLLDIGTMPNYERAQSTWPGPERP